MNKKDIVRQIRKEFAAKGGKARAAKLTPAQLSEIGRIGAAAAKAKRAGK